NQPNYRTRRVRGRPPACRSHCPLSGALTRIRARTNNRPPFNAVQRSKPVRKIIVSEFVSLDGVMQAPGGKDEDTDGGFTQGGWTQPYWHDEIGAHFAQTFSESDALLLGRRTWQTHGGAFESMADDDPNAFGMNTMSKYVVSTTLTSTAAWRNSTLI